MKGIHKGPGLIVCNMNCIVVVVSHPQKYMRFSKLQNLGLPLKQMSQHIPQDRREITAEEARVLLLKQKLQHKTSRLKTAVDGLEAIQVLASELLDTIRSNEGIADAAQQVSNPSASRGILLTCLSAKTIKVLSLPTCERIAETLKLSPQVYNMILKYAAEIDHKYWYWSMVNNSRMSKMNAYAMSVAMHVDTKIVFDDVTCIAVPAH